MPKKTKGDAPHEPSAELLPPREALSLLNADPAAYTSMLGDPTAAGAADPTAGTADTASSTAGSAQDLADDAQAAGDAPQTVSDEPQTITTDSTQSASSET